MQSRMGPMRTGWHGLLQPFADALKLLGKEDLMPDGADRVLFLIAPIIAFVPVDPRLRGDAVGRAVRGLQLRRRHLPRLRASPRSSRWACSSAGWASHNKYSLIGGFRAAAQQISYEVPMILVDGGRRHARRVDEALDASSRRRRASGTSSRSRSRSCCSSSAMLAELNRTPFDMPEAESELVAGFNIEYSSMRFALFFVAEYMNIFTVSLLTMLLFLGGWNGPVLPDIVWLLAKTYAVVFLIIWVRATFPRVRVDQLMAVGWKLLFPAALVNVLHHRGRRRHEPSACSSSLEFAAAARLRLDRRAARPHAPATRRAPRPPPRGAGGGGVIGMAKGMVDHACATCSRPRSPCSTRT